MLGAARPGFACPLTLKRLLFIDQFLIKVCAIGLGYDIVEQLNPEIALRYIRDAGLSQEACERRETKIGLRWVPSRGKEK
jgi:hypothetical protein